MQAARWERQGRNALGYWGALTRAFGLPLPAGEGLDLGRNEASLSLPLSLWERVGVRVFQCKQTGSNQC